MARGDLSLSSIVVSPFELMVPLPDCVTVELGHIPKGLPQDMEARDFDFAVVTETINLHEHETHVLTRGLVHRSRLEQLVRVGATLERSDPLILTSELEMNQEGDLSVADLLERMAHYTLAIVVDPESLGCGDGEVMRYSYGLVTISDLNKPTFRAAVYKELATLEVALAGLVQAGYPDPLAWIERVQDEAEKQRILDYWRQSQIDRVNVGPEAGANLAHLLNAVAAKPELYRRLGYESRNRFEQVTGSLAQVRNQVMHPVRPLIRSRDDCSGLLGSLRLVLDICSRSQDPGQP